MPSFLGRRDLLGKPNNLIIGASEMEMDAMTSDAVRRASRRPARSPAVPGLVGAAVGLALALGAAAIEAATQQTDRLRFEVLLDQDAIGEHVFEVSSDGSREEVSSRASFDINFWIFTAYRYRHESQETWRDGCLQRISAQTDDNGKDYRVQGEEVDERLALSVNGESTALPGCVMTFAYWDRDFLAQERLLNPQTGELVPVRVQAQGNERVRLGDREVEAQRYLLSTDALDLVLWYSDDHGWVGLESDTGRGKTLRYRRIHPT
jgi:hypothetical protein